MNYKIKGYDEEVAQKILNALYCRNCGNEDLHVDAKITELLSIGYKCFCRECGQRGTLHYSYDGGHAALPDRYIGVRDLDEVDVLW